MEIDEILFLERFVGVRLRLNGEFFGTLVLLCNAEEDMTV